MLGKHLGNSMDKPLLILDLDETLIRGVTEPLERDYDMLLGPYFVYFRPHARDFLGNLENEYTLGFWSSATISYVGPICRQLMKGFGDPLFVWDRERCTHRFDHFKKEPYYLKDLRRIEKNGLSLNRVLIVDDELRKVSLQYGNAVIVKQYLGQTSDYELLHLERYLSLIAREQDFRNIDKTEWRQHRELT